MQNKDKLSTRIGNWQVEQTGDKVKITHFLRADNSSDVLEFGKDEVGELGVVLRTLLTFLEMS